VVTTDVFSEEKNRDRSNLKNDLVIRKAEN
jgi:hypothetical protein